MFRFNTSCHTHQIVRIIRPDSSVYPRLLLKMHCLKRGECTATVSRAFGTKTRTRKAQAVRLEPKWRRILVSCCSLFLCWNRERKSTEVYLSKSTQVNASLCKSKQVYGSRSLFLLLCIWGRDKSSLAADRGSNPWCYMQELEYTHRSGFDSRREPETQHASQSNRPGTSFFCTERRFLENTKVCVLN